MSERTITHRQSKLGNGIFVAGHRVSVMFTYQLNTTDELDEINPEFLEASRNLTGTLGGLISSISGDPVLTNPVGPGYGAENAKKILAATKGTQEILVGAGIKSARAEQQINVTQENALGYFDIVETVPHNVQGNTFTMSKMALQMRLLSECGVAPLGKEVLTSPQLNAYILDIKERQRGIDRGFVKIMGMTINSNSLDTSVGQLMMENVTFRANRIVRAPRVSKALYNEMRKQYRSIMSGVETLQPYQLDDGF